MNAKKSGLGRGLSALLETPESDLLDKDVESGRYMAGAVASISLKHIEANPYQPRQDFEAESLQELAESITRQGIIQPVTVRRLDNGRYQLISGERRFRAAQMAGLQTIPAFIRIAKDHQMLEMALVENIQRANLNPIEVAISYQRLMDECSLTQEQLSEHVGQKRATIANYVRLLKLPAELQIALRDGQITMGHARALINVELKELQLSILQQVIENDLSVRDVEEMARDSQVQGAEKPRPRKKINFIPDHFSAARQQLAEAFQAKVELKRNHKGKGTIIIPFASDDDFERLLGILKRER
ncbi:MAG TPA: ParB/RepB/Spo0J family partition protein [Bacteroidales bacterium]|nr:ParB/RepB/Spo0J family partition protein [Bacteroidales bacterium]HRZ49326.1 ParB/RepB/Spo0J family partition protein [Bacteroidales bacterium]